MNLKNLLFNNFNIMNCSDNYMIFCKEKPARLMLLFIFNFNQVK